MFGNKKGKKSSELDSLIGSNTRMVGDVHFSGGLHIDGIVKGNVIAEGEDSLVTTSDKARIEGNVHVHNMVLSGEVIGDVYALKHIELAPNARVTGNVYYNLIEMAGGAEVNGSLIHYDNKDAKPAQKNSGAEIPATSGDHKTSNSEYPVNTIGKAQSGCN
ncbi:MAG: polymer-forming cytoskeletal protein [Gammaproteobacteria bacterium]|nr:polymer-forming cytoskeletal protein [Gammaproteobacteria bacterium]